MLYYIFNNIHPKTVDNKHDSAVQMQISGDVSAKDPIIDSALTKLNFPAHGYSVILCVSISAVAFALHVFT